MAIGDKKYVLMEEDKGVANGVASLDATGKVPESQLPNMVVTETDPTVPDWAKEPTKPTYTADEVGALPDTTVIPTTTSELTNDSGFITDEADPTVPAWAKEPSKPTYTAAEVGAATVAEVEAALTAADEAKAAAAAAGLTPVSGTITTSWTENSTTGAKTQNVAIAGVTAAMNAYSLDHDPDGYDTTTSDGLTALVEGNNQFLELITNGFAKTYDGGITFTIFGDAPTVSIPFWAGVS